MVLTALIMGMTVKAERPMTDAEIRAKALTLGMVDPNSLSLSDVGTSSGALLSPSHTPDSEKQLDEEETPTPSQTPDETQQPGEEETLSPSPAPVETQQPEEEKETPTPSPSPDEAQPSAPDIETVTIVIVRGDNSYTVSRRLEEAGLVESAREYDSYLVDHGYSKTIRTGTYRIPLDATWEEIADIIA